MRFLRRHPALLGTLPALLVPLLGACDSSSAGDPGPAERGPSAAEAARRLGPARDDSPAVVACRAALDAGEVAEVAACLAGLSDESVDTYELRARLALLENDVLSALRAVEDVRERWPDDPRSFATACEIYAATGRMEAAYEELRQGLIVSGGTPELERARAVYYLSQPGGAERGLQHLEDAIAADPGLPFVRHPLEQAHLLVARTALSRSEFEAALEHAREARELDPTSIEGRRVTVEALVGLKDLEGAVGILEELHAEGVPLQGELAAQRQRAGMLALLERRREDAFAHWMRARQLGLDDEQLGTGARLLAEEASRLIEEGIDAYYAERFDDAHTLFSQALAHDPGSLEAPNHLAAACFRLEHYREAAMHWSTVIDAAQAERLPLPEPVHLNLARAWRLSGEPELARSVLEDYLTLEPEGPWVAQTEAMLEHF